MGGTGVSKSQVSRLCEAIDAQMKAFLEDIGSSEAETFWTEFLRKLRRRGLRGLKLVVSDAHEGIKVSPAPS
jgi:putative transposase